MSLQLIILWHLFKPTRLFLVACVHYNYKWITNVVIDFQISCSIFWPCCDVLYFFDFFSKIVDFGDENIYLLLVQQTMDLPYELEGLQGENSTLKDALKLDSIKTVRIIKHLEKI